MNKNDVTPLLSKIISKEGGMTKKLKAADSAEAAAEAGKTSS